MPRADAAEPTGRAPLAAFVVVAVGAALALLVILGLLAGFFYFVPQSAPQPASAPEAPPGPK